MNKKLVLSLCAVALLAASAFSQTVDELIDKNVKARGGLEKIKAVKSMRISGKMKMGAMEAPLLITNERPDHIRVEFTIQGMTGVQAYDGATGWAVMPFMGKKEAEQMPAEELKQIRDEADFDGQLIDYKTKGTKIEYIGKEDVQGTPAYKLKVTTKDGNESNYYLDAENYLEIRHESKRKVQGQEVEGESIIGDYKEFGGVLYPTSMENHAKGHEGSQSVTIEKIEINPKLDAALFHMPEAKKPAAEEPKKQ